MLKLASALSLVLAGAAFAPTAQAADALTAS